MAYSSADGAEPRFALPEARRRTPQRMAARIAVTVVAILVALLGLAGFTLRHFQEHFVFSPALGRVLPGHQEFHNQGENIQFTTVDGIVLTAWLVHPPADVDVRDEAVLLLPGSTGSRAERAQLGRLLAARGFTVLLLDYRGRVGNPGTTTAVGALLDARAAQHELSELGFPPDHVIYFGESFGAGIAAELAVEVPPLGLFLRSPFAEFADAARATLPLPQGVLRWVFSRTALPVARLVAASDVPVSVIWGSEDEIVPPESSREVAESARNLYEQFEVGGAGHNEPFWQRAFVADAVVRLADHARGAPESD